MTFAKELRGYMRENGLNHRQASKRLGVGQSTVTYWLSGNQPNRKNKKRVLEIIRGQTINTQSGSIDSILAKAQKHMTPDRFVRVSFPVQTLTDVLTKAEAYGEVVVEEEGKLYKVVKMGA